MPRVPRIARRMGRKLSAPGSKPSVVLFVLWGRPLRPPASRRNQHFVVAGGDVPSVVGRDRGRGTRHAAGPPAANPRPYGAGEGPADAPRRARIFSRISLRLAQR